MSTRKSTNKQNSETAATATTPESSTLTLRSKQIQDTGSEISEAPTTPTSRDSGQSAPSESKRTRRTNSTQSQSTPKRTTSDAAESPTNEAGEKTAAKNTATKDKDAKNTEDGSPITRKRKIFEKRPAMATRKSAGSPAMKNSPVRTSLRAAARNNANLTKSPPQKGGRKKKADVAADSKASTPIKRERADSEKSDEEPASKRVKIEKDEIDENVEGPKKDEDQEEPEEEILMEICTERPSEVKIKEELIEIHDDESKDADVADSISENMSEKKTSDKESKSDKDLKEADKLEKSSTEKICDKESKSDEDLKEADKPEKTSDKESKSDEELKEADKPEKTSDKESKIDKDLKEADKPEKTSDKESKIDEELLKEADKPEKTSDEESTSHKDLKESDKLENSSADKISDKESKNDKDLKEADKLENSSTETSDTKSDSVVKRQSRRKTIETNTQQDKKITRTSKQESAKTEALAGKRRGRKPAWLVEQLKVEAAKVTSTKNAATTKENPAKSEDENEKPEMSDSSKTVVVKEEPSNTQPAKTDTTKLDAEAASVEDSSQQLPEKSEVSKSDVQEQDSSKSQTPTNHPPATEESEKTDPIKKTTEVIEPTKLESDLESVTAITPAVPEAITTVRTKSPSSPQVPEIVACDDDQSNSESEQLIFTTTTAAVNENKDATKDQKQEPLTIDITTSNSDEKESIASTICTAGSEKSASLSPMDLQSEELSAVSVKQFSKEPEFLENNLGIEMDPKLGEIVQSAVGEKPDEKDEIHDETDRAEKSEVESETAKEENETSTELPKSPKRLSQSRKSSESGSAKSPGLAKDDDDDDAELNGSDLLRDGEVLMLEESTEEESAPSQKTDENEDSPVAEPDSKQAVADSSEKKSDKSETEVAFEIKTEEPEVTDDSTNPVADISSDPDSKEEEPSENTQPEHASSVNGDVVATENGTFSEDHLMNHDDDDVLEKRATTPNESSAMEIDSGVSDVAENNSNDPNEDLSQEIIEPGTPKTEEEEAEAVDDKKIVLPDDKVSVVDSKDVDSKEQIQDTKENKENIQLLKLTIAKNDTPIVEKKEVAPVIIRKIPETPETLKQKEKHLKFLGLLTLKAADEAKIEKQKRRQQYGGSKKQNGSTNGDTLDTTTGRNGGGNGAGNSTDAQRTGHEYTGTLKTVIKLNRPMSTSAPHSIFDGKKKTNNSQSSSSNSGGSANSQNGGSSGSHSMALVPAAGRHSLKMTFQKGRVRGGGAGSCGNFERIANNGGTSSHHSSEDTYYTIQNEGETGAQESVTAHGRKSHLYRSNTDQGAAAVDAAGGDKKEVVIPEKASSFAIHPGRLCQDQCYYCGGKFGLYDTPCHVAQIKSLDRQKKILDNEEKLTVDNCLCDACFRHVDRRANAAQKKRLSAPANLDGIMGGSIGMSDGTERDHDPSIAHHHASHKAVCFVANCGQRASHTFRRKGLRKTIRKLLGHESDMANLGGRLPICDKHYEVITPCLECALCKRRLVRNQMHHISQDIQLLESLLIKKGIPIKFQANPAVCKLCKYFTNLLLKPPEGKTQKAQFVKNYRRRLLQFHNVDESEEESEAEEQEETTDQTAVVPPAKRGRKPKNIQTLAGNKAIATATSLTGSSVPVSSEDGNSSNDVVEIDANDSVDQRNASGRMQLDNDVMVDYDVPVLSEPPSPTVGARGGQQKSAVAQQQPSKLQTILQGGNVSRNNDDISIALRSNPNISMRELLPGEEEMGLQVNVPFGGSSSQRTPEGWTRIQTFLQYDEPTRRLWEHLQKPYGNQSSFLRHLILLEKYFRNGDLILSQAASTTAVAYSETVQNRLRSFDYRLPPSTTVVSRKSSTASSSASSNDNVNNSNKQQQQQIQASAGSGLLISSIANASQEGGTTSKDGEPVKKLQNKLTITVTPKSKLMPPETMQASRNAPSTSTGNTSSAPPSSDNNSILKTNLLSRKNSAIEIIPIGGCLNNDTNTRPSPLFALTKQQKLLAAANQLSTSNPPARSSNLPPELISINRNNPHSLLLSSRNHINSLASMKNKLHSNNPLLQRHHASTASSSSSSMSMTSTSLARPLKMPPTIVKLPTTLSTHERLHSRNWRPSLMPINSGPPARSAPGVLYQTADGRKLPSLVQVQSGGKPFLISIHDYNRMCLLRREKLLRDQMMKGGGGGGSGGGGSGPSGSGGDKSGGNSNSGANSLLKGALSSSSLGSGRSASGGMMPHHGKQW